MMRVGVVHAVATREVDDTVATHVLEERLAASIGMPREAALEEDSLAQPGLSDLERIELGGLEHAVDRNRTGEDQVSASRLDAWDLRALGSGQRGEPLDQIS